MVKAELEQIKKQNIDITDFESELEGFKYLDMFLKLAELIKSDRLCGALSTRQKRALTDMPIQQRWQNLVVNGTISL